MKFLLLTFCFYFLTAFQNDEYTLVNSIPFKEAKFTTDRQGNVYVIAENQLLLLDTIGNLKANYSDLNSGSLYSIDATNSLKILIFYPDFARIQILNNKLSLTSTIDLRNLNIIQPLVACQSFQEGYWVYDLQDEQLKKINLRLQLQYESGNLNQLLGYQVLPNYICEADDYVYLNDPRTGILIFDRYGSYYKTIPFSGLKSFQIIDNDLLFVKDDKLLKFNLKTLEKNEILLPSHDSILNARIEQQKLFLLTMSSLNFYSY